MKRGLLLFLVPMAAAFIGCEGDAAKPGAAAVAEADLAVPADFEVEAQTSITPANYKAELDALDKEISSE
jgi:hypothetical protein